jgi:hypothetical protein
MAGRPDVFEAEEARNPMLFAVRKSGGITHVHDGIGNPSGYNRAPCGKRPPIFGLELVRMGKVLPTSWDLALAVKPKETVKEEARRNFKDFLSYVTCAVCIVATQEFADLWWARWEEREGRG